MLYEIAGSRLEPAPTLFCGDERLEAALLGLDSSREESFGVGPA
jgi:hypothetical protein